jgi:competence protein ComEA
MLIFLKNHAFFLLGGACIFIVGIIYIASRNAEPEIIREGDIRDSEIIFQAEIPVFAPQEEKTIIINITGAVKNPGVYELPEGARVNDALILAGGENENADLSGVNLAAFLRDAMMIVIPEIGEEAVFIFDGESDGTQSGGLININTATLEELQTLSGIGPVLAQNIIDFREAHGNFSSVDELIHVPRIGAATLERLRVSITVG